MQLGCLASAVSSPVESGQMHFLPGFKITCAGHVLLIFMQCFLVLADDVEPVKPPWLQACVYVHTYAYMDVYCVLAGSVARRLHMAKVTNYLLADRDSDPYYVAVHIPGTKVILDSEPYCVAVHIPGTKVI